jgi:hypothetical protein
MRHFIFSFLALFTLLSCNNDDGPEYSALADFIGQWELEGRTLNDGVPLEIGEESLVFTEDNNFTDLAGNYALTNETETTGHFVITGPPYDLTFENTTGNILTVGFNIYDEVLTFVYLNEDDDYVREVWRKNYYYED